MVRPLGSGYNNQLRILSLLESKPLSFQEIVNSLMLDRTRTKKNLDVLINRKLVENYRDGHKSMYRSKCLGFMEMLINYPRLFEYFLGYKGNISLFDGWLQRDRRSTDEFLKSIANRPFYEDFDDERRETLAKKHSFILKELSDKYPEPFKEKGHALSDGEILRLVEEYKKVKLLKRRKDITKILPFETELLSVKKERKKRVTDNITTRLLEKVN